MKNLSILAFTDRGRALAEQILSKLPEGCRGELYDSEKQTAKEYLARQFAEKDTVLFICAAGIAVRLIALLLKSKDTDPAVVVMDEFGRYAVSLLSGHLGGANDAALVLSGLVGAEPVITTATDLNKKFAVDIWSKKAGCRIINIGQIKSVSAAVLRGEKVGFQSSFYVEGELPFELTRDSAETGICVSLSGKEKPFANTLNAVPKIVSIGAGCRKGIDAEQFERFILKNLEEQGIAIEAAAQIASVDLKKEEPAILAFSRKYGIPFVTYTAEELNRAEGDFAASALVKSVAGVDNVCERSAVLASGNGRKILSKISGGGCTCALAMKDWKCRF